MLAAGTVLGPDRILGARGAGGVGEVFGARRMRPGCNGTLESPLPGAVICNDFASRRCPVAAAVPPR